MTCSYENISTSMYQSSHNRIVRFGRCKTERLVWTSARTPPRPHSLTHPLGQLLVSLTSCSPTAAALLSSQFHHHHQPVLSLVVVSLCSAVTVSTFLDVFALCFSPRLQSHPDSLPQSVTSVCGPAVCRRPIPSRNQADNFQLPSL